MEIVRGRSGGTEWLTASRAPRGPLEPVVGALSGYEERTAGPLVRLEGPIPLVVVIIDLGPGLAVSAGGEHRYERFTSGFVAGLTERTAWVRHEGHQQGMQLNLTPTAARRLFDVPMSELSETVVPLEDLLPCGARDLVSRAGALETWSERLDEVERTLSPLLHPSHDVGHRVVQWALSRIIASGGRVDIGSLRQSSGYSHKHLMRLFLEHTGLTPKRLARVARFHELNERMRAKPETQWSELALASGYTDQAHMAREVRRMTQMTPTEWRRSIVPFEGTEVSGSDSYKTAGDSGG